MASLRYKPGWTFKVGPQPDRLGIYATTPDSLSPSRTRCTGHGFTIPPDLTEREFVRWVLDCVLLAEQHEACEFLQIDGRRPFWPYHQDEGSPYELVERWEQ